MTSTRENIHTAYPNSIRESQPLESPRFSKITGPESKSWEFRNKKFADRQHGVVFGVLAVAPNERKNISLSRSSLASTRESFARRPKNGEGLLMRRLSFLQNYYATKPLGERNWRGQKRRTENVSALIFPNNSTTASRYGHTSNPFWIRDEQLLQIDSQTLQAWPNRFGTLHPLD